MSGKNSKESPMVYRRRKIKYGRITSDLFNKIFMNDVCCEFLGLSSAFPNELPNFFDNTKDETLDTSKENIVPLFLL
jgi:hypothetical protein